MYNLRLLRQLRHANLLNTAATRLLASTHKHRPLLNPLANDQLEHLKVTYFSQRSTLSREEWQSVRQTLIDSYKHITAHNVDAVILGICSAPEQLALAKDYVSHLQQRGTSPNAATLGRLLRTYNAAYRTRSLTETEESEILHVCRTLQSGHDTLDATTCEHLIHGLVATTMHWQQAVPLLEMMKVTSAPTVAAYSALVEKAFSAGQPTLAWRLLDEMLQARKQPKCEVYLSYLQHIAKDKSTFSAQLEQMLQFLGRHNIVISDKVTQQLLALARQLPEHLQLVDTRIDRFGKCATCQQHLQAVSISDAEFEELRACFLHKVLIRSDVFQKSTPAEVGRFKQFIEQTAPYDCVIDGLNVAYSTGAKKPPKQLANLLAAVVRHFKEHRKRVLVLGRQHMQNWSKTAMHYVHSNASVFLTNNLTHDDPFLLYATLTSGQATDFFSRDLMRAHAHLLGHELKSVFRRWQQEHQYSLLTQTQTGQIIVKEPIRYSLSAHKVGALWHVPCCQSYTPHPAETFEAREKWLCLSVSPV